MSTKKLDFFLDQEYIPAKYFKEFKHKQLYSMLRNIKTSVDNAVYTGKKTKMDNYLAKPKITIKRLDLDTIRWAVNRYLRNIGFNDRGAATGLRDRALEMVYDKRKKTYYYYESGPKAAQHEHIYMVKISTYMLIFGYLRGFWDCNEKSGEITKGVRWLQEIIFNSFGTAEVEPNNHKRLTEHMLEYLSRKGLDDKDILVTFRDRPEVMEEVWEYSQNAKHYIACDIEFIPLDIKTAPINNKNKVITTFPGIVSNAFLNLISKSVSKKRVKKYVPKKKRKPKITLESKGFI